MTKKDNSTIDREPRETVIVFAHYKDLLGQIVYKFLGEFHSSKEESNKYKKASFRNSIQKRFFIEI